jgi:hypothetical protein
MTKKKEEEQKAPEENGLAKKSDAPPGLNINIGDHSVNIPPEVLHDNKINTAICGMGLALVGIICLFIRVFSDWNPSLLGILFRDAAPWVICFFIFISCGLWLNRLSKHANKKNGGPVLRPRPEDFR